MNTNKSIKVHVNCQGKLENSYCLFSFLEKVGEYFYKSNVLFSSCLFFLICTETIFYVWNQIIICCGHQVFGYKFCYEEQATNRNGYTLYYTNDV